MLVLALLAGAASAASQPAAPAARAATATVRIERAGSITADHWSKAPITSRREVVRTDENGRKITVRLIEHQ
jgi:hypothetical protein